MPDGSPWPRISIVTPSYNQAQFLEETIRSVLLQGYPDLEYIIIDGGSTDGSVAIIRQYESWLSYWVSEPDVGQSAAIAKGFSHVTGKYLTWLNSDDSYLPGAIACAASAFTMHPSAALVYGGCELFEEGGSRQIRVWQGAPSTVRALILGENTIPQQAAFMRRTALEQAGGVDTTLHYVMDHELWTRLGRAGDLVHISDILARFRFHPDSKTVSHSIEMLIEWKKVIATSAWFGEAANEAELDEADRRLEVRLAAERMLAEELPQSVAHLESALSKQPCPFGTPDGVVQYMANYPGLSGQSMTSERLASHFRRLQPATLTANIRRLRSYAMANDHIEKAFQRHQIRDYVGVRRHLAIGLWRNPRWLMNKGVLWIGMESLVGEKLTMSARRVISALRYKRRSQDASS